MDDCTRKKIEEVEEFSKKLAAFVDIAKRTQHLGDGSHASAITSCVNLYQHPTANSLTDILQEIHAALHVDAKAKLDAKYEADYAALNLRAPKKKKRKPAKKEKDHGACPVGEAA